jgi:hypothetical protein
MNLIVALPMLRELTGFACYTLLATRAVAIIYSVLPGSCLTAYNISSAFGGGGAKLPAKMKRKKIL